MGIRRDHQVPVRVGESVHQDEGLPANEKCQGVARPLGGSSPAEDATRLGFSPPGDVAVTPR
ncbi:hypothetical protein WFJ45_22765, partial [Salmonella enterica subsp. enterica serovar Minnesota]|uniref:hypothetical protein n=1 Tax=Salmonella enterica TaxID=28901 RepID=UPI003D2D18D5